MRADCFTGVSEEFKRERESLETTKTDRTVSAEIAASGVKLSYYNFYGLSMFLSFLIKYARKLPLHVSTIQH